MGVFDNYVEENGTIIDNGWVKWFHSGIPDEPESLRDLIRILALIYGHCLNCTALSGCYFVKSKMPRNPDNESIGLLHKNCHCMAKEIAKPNYASETYCSIDKFTKYIFAKKGILNGKSKLFESLGFNIDDSYYLKQEFERQARNNYLNGNYKLGSLDSYGQNINISVELSTPVKQNIIFISGWKVRPLGRITCNTPLGDK